MAPQRRSKRVLSSAFKPREPMVARDVSSEHKCDDCGEFLVLKNSKRGNQFWGCANWSKNHNDQKCLVGIDLLPDGETNDSSGDNTKDKTSELVQSRVDWSDASLRRYGWKTKYVALGASMRSVTMPSAPSSRTAWIAWSDLSSFGSSVPFVFCRDLKVIGIND